MDRLFQALLDFTPIYILGAWLLAFIYFVEKIVFRVEDLVIIFFHRPFIKK